MARGRKALHSLINNSKNEISKSEKFLFELNKTIVMLDKDRERKPSQNYNPSSMICLRNMYFKRIGQELDDSSASPELVGMTESGSSRHIHIQKYIIAMQDKGFDCKYIEIEDWIKKHKPVGTKVIKKIGMETLCYNSILDIRFMADGIIYFDGKYYVLELKTEISYKSYNRTAIASEHLPQSCSYSICLGIDNIMFLYENRDNCSKKVYNMIVTDEMKNQHVIAPIELCEKYVKKLVLPPKYQNDYTKKPCIYCKYKLSCKKAG